MKNLFLYTLLLVISGCATTDKDNNVNYNTLSNYEIVYLDSKITKTSKMALNQINNNNELLNIEIFLFRQDKDDLKSIMKANKKKKELSEILSEKDVGFIYDPKKETKNAILKVQ